MVERKVRAALMVFLIALCPAELWAQSSEERLSREQRARLVEELFAAEPALSRVSEVATRYYELHPDQLERVRGQLRSKSAVPYFIVSERYQNNGADRRLDIQFRDGVSLRTIDDGYQAQRSQTAGVLSWNLPMAVMSDSEFQTYQLALVQRQIQSTVNGWYYSRRILLLELLIDPPVDPRARTSLRLRVDGFTALLDIYTGGWFSRQLPEIPEELMDARSPNQRIGR